MAYALAVTELPSPDSKMLTVSKGLLSQTAVSRQVIRH